jgi:hypothetical protein
MVAETLEPYGYEAAENGNPLHTPGNVIGIVELPTSALLLHCQLRALNEKADFSNQLDIERNLLLKYTARGSGPFPATTKTDEGWIPGEASQHISSIRLVANKQNGKLKANGLSNSMAKLGPAAHLAESTSASPSAIPSPAPPSLASDRSSSTSGISIRTSLSGPYEPSRLRDSYTPDSAPDQRGPPKVGTASAVPSRLSGSATPMLGSRPTFSSALPSYNPAIQPPGSGYYRGDGNGHGWENAEWRGQYNGLSPGYPPHPWQQSARQYSVPPHAADQYPENPEAGPSRRADS